MGAQPDDSGAARQSEAGRRARARLRANAGGEGAPPCCPFYHEAVELIGRRWTGAILRVLMGGPLRFSEIAQAVPELSDRLLSERMKELEARGMVERRVLSGPPLRVEYQLSRMGQELEPTLSELQQWANRWLRRRSGNGASPSRRQRVTTL
jgi:DNA-binding HxlR family transcriptional regulator